MPEKEKQLNLPGFEEETKEKSLPMPGAGKNNAPEKKMINLNQRSLPLKKRKDYLLPTPKEEKEIYKEAFGVDLILNSEKTVREEFEAAREWRKKKFGDEPEKKE